MRIDEGFDDDLPERYVAALLVIAEAHDITVNEAHSGISELLEEMDIDVELDVARKKNTKH
jgi:hypothetical protein